uniref:Putative nuclease HARBI1 n=1 Tax=Acanthochromis polyacanthus TaxID=80966 RepID=A0A3Q1G5V3_9TELE
MSGRVFDSHLILSLSQRTYREALTWQVLSIATTILVEEGTVKGRMLSVQSHWSSTLLKNCMLAFALGLLILSTLQTLSRQKLQRRTKRSHSLSVEEQILIALHFYASGTFYQVVGDNIGVDKSTVSDVVKAVSIALASLVSQFVSLPKDDQIAQTKHNFFLLGNMPNTIGVIDCTPVHIQAPHEREWEYINRKGRRSINLWVMLTSSSQTAFALYRELQTNRPDGAIVGDSAYPLLPWLMTPFFAATTPAQARFNIAHCKARCAIERLNGVLKRCFACLNYLRVEPQGSLSWQIVAGIGCQVPPLLSINGKLWHEPLCKQNNRWCSKQTRDIKFEHLFDICSMETVTEELQVVGQ